MVTIVTVIGNPEHAVDRADRASNTGTDRAANYRAHRTRRAAAFAGAFVRAADNALCMPKVGASRAMRAQPPRRRDRISSANRPATPPS